jgi:hypothetical protein
MYKCLLINCQSLLVCQNSDISVLTLETSERLRLHYSFSGSDDKYSIVGHVHINCSDRIGQMLQFNLDVDYEVYWYFIRITRTTLHLTGKRGTRQVLKLRIDAFENTVSDLTIGPYVFMPSSYIFGFKKIFGKDAEHNRVTESVARLIITRDCVFTRPSKNVIKADRVFVIDITGSPDINRKWNSTGNSCIGKKLKIAHSHFDSGFAYNSNSWVLSEYTPTHPGKGIYMYTNIIDAINHKF